MPEAQENNIFGGANSFMEGGGKYIVSGVQILIWGMLLKDTGSSNTGKGSGGANISVRDKLLEEVENAKLKNAVNEIYRPGGKIGDGGLADAVRHELKTGELVGGKSHIQKAIERVTNLENIIKNQNLNSSDFKIANDLLTDLKNALGGN